MADTAQVLADLATANEALDGIVADIQHLEDVIAGGGTPEEVAAAVALLSAKAQAINAAR